MKELNMNYVNYNLIQLNSIWLHIDLIQTQLMTELNINYYFFLKHTLVLSKL